MLMLISANCVTTPCYWSSKIFIFLQNLLGVSNVDQLQK
jgi:hypothetical protein